MREWKRSFQTAASSFMGLQARIEKVLDVSIAREVEKLESNLLVLATVASAGPFVGCLGRSGHHDGVFRSIAASRNTSLAVGGARHSRGLVCDRHRAFRGDPGAYRL